MANQKKWVVAPPTSYLARAKSFAEAARILNSELLLDGFSDTGSTSWRSVEEAMAEVQESLQPGRISRIAVDDQNEALGWIGGIQRYGGNVWELHPLVVRRNRQRQGLGRLLIADFEKQVAQRGGHTILLGTDDENGRT